MKPRTENSVGGELPVANLTLQDLRQRPAFQGGSRQFTIGEIIDAAEWRGELGEFRRGWLARWASAAAAQNIDLEPSDAEVEAAIDAFRYARDLVSAEECERWLRQRGLGFSELQACFSRRLQAELAEVEAPSDAAVDEVAFMADAVLSDEFTLWSRRLARRVALSLETGGYFPAGAPLTSWYSDMEAQMAAMMAETATPERRRRALADRRLGLMRATLEVAEFDSEHAAREARLCSTVDGARLSETAAANGFVCRKVEAFLEELPESWRSLLMSARAGDVVCPPNDSTGRFLLVQLLRRREPTLEHKRVRERIDAGLVERRLAELETRHIRWLINVEVEA